MPDWTFIREVFLANKTTGAFAPSSRVLADVVTNMAQVSTADVLVEYGPGTGVFTEAILREKKPEAHFIALEVNEEFVAATKARCPGAEVIHDGAQHTAAHLTKAGFDGCDAIVSGLPWTRFPESLQDEILDATYHVLRPGGRFVTFGYAFSPLLPAGARFFKGKFPERFTQHRRSPMVWANFPPCYVWIGEKPA